MSTNCFFNLIFFAFKPSENGSFMTNNQEIKATDFGARRNQTDSDWYLFDKFLRQQSMTGTSMQFQRRKINAKPLKQHTHKHLIMSIFLMIVNHVLTNNVHTLILNNMRWFAFCVSFSFAHLCEPCVFFKLFVAWCSSRNSQYFSFLFFFFVDRSSFRVRRWFYFLYDFTINGASGCLSLLLVLVCTCVYLFVCCKWLDGVCKRISV